MKRFLTTGSALLAVAALGLIARPVAAQQLITNGGFETGLTGWTVVDFAGGSGSWFSQTGTGSPANGFTVPAPPEGSFAAMTDQGGPGAHVLYQDFLVPGSVDVAILSFQYYLLNQATSYFTPDSLDPFGNLANQQARVDIITTTADVFSLAAGDVLQNIYQTQPGDAAESGYTAISTDITALLNAHLGQTLRLRFAEADNQLFFANGVDAVSLTVRGTQDVPEPGTLALIIGVAIPFAGFAIRRRK